MNEALQQSAIKPVKLFPEVGRRLQEKTPQTLRVRIAGQSGQILERAIVAQERGRLQAIQAQENGIDQRQEHLREAVVITGPGISKMSGKKISQLQHSGKFMKEENSAIMGQAPMIKGDSYILW